MTFLFQILLYSIAFLLLIVFSDFSFQRNHSLFGTVVSALTGHKPIPFSNRTQSLHLNHTQPHPKVSPTNSLTAPPKLSPQNSVNGKVSPALSCNHINVDYVNSINRTPTPLAPVKVAPASQAAPQLLDTKQDRYGRNYILVHLFCLF